MRKSFWRHATSRFPAGPVAAAGPLARLVSDERGSVAIWVGLSLIMFVGCAGMAIDTARGYMVKARMSQALDAAALAGAKSLLSDSRDADINMFFAANFDASSFGATVAGPVIEADTEKNTVKVSAVATLDTTLMSVLGFKDMKVAAQATAIRAINGLDVVISIDMSGSMCNPCTKIQAAINAANTMVDTLYNDPNPKTVEINNITYDLLNIGMVPWNSKVNVTTNKIVDSTTYNPALTTTEPVAFTHPLTGEARSVVYKTNVSHVRFMDPPDSDWRGGVYARYIGDNDQTNDADMTLGYASVGNKQWQAFEAIPTLQGESRTNNPPFSNNSGRWTSGEAPTTSPYNWQNQSRACHEAYWNDSRNDPYRPDGVYPVGHALAGQPIVPLAPSYWKRSTPTQSLHSECVDTLSVGIVPLTGVKDAASKSVVTDSIDDLYAGSNFPVGGTNVPQGLYWAWEVLMPGEPFNQAKVSVPFKRTQAIVLLTDGANFGSNGDAYKGVFGWDTAARTNSQNGTLPNGQNNNLDNRLLQLAKNIKGSNPAQGVKIFVVQYNINDNSLATLLKQVATEPNAPYYFYAPGDAELEDAFKQIAASLSVLRLAN
ncbi:Flp pilus assembly protein TadG [Dongia mobilis]|uniref:Flp pilus assembly protein TadG n=1 Tax=Dongia mobilis TaxID=578943 RepID=A0A4R6WJD2_9PROT|nr:pilus assembly protein TadG-related protein [Dongia mobilis]TDQ78943.1 Flp pilus assembly protein TadG [Dongia mobilis]